MREAPPAYYPFTAPIEMAIALACTNSPRFWSLAGHALDPKRMKAEPARAIVANVKAYAALTGGSPTRTEIVVQRFATQMDADGSLTLDELEAIQDYLIDADLNGAVSAEELAAVVVPVVKKAHFKDAVAAAQLVFGKNGSPEDVAHLLEQVAKIGAPSTTGIPLSSDQIIASDDFWPKAVEDDSLSRTGIEELDTALGGGMERGALGLFVGGSGAGKSMTLAHIAAQSLLDQRDVFYVTLELSQARQGQRIWRNLVDMTKLEQMLPGGREIFDARRAALEARGLGRLAIHYMEPGETSPRDVRVALHDYCRANPGFRPQVLAVDFLDKVRVNRKASLYEDMLAVTDGLRSIAVEADGWIWTASQSDRKSTNRPWLDLDAVADSMNKIRSADIVIGIGRTDEDQTNNMVRFSLPKRREGEGAHSRIGPLSWDPEHGRICVVSRTNPW